MVQQLKRERLGITLSRHDDGELALSNGNKRADRLVVDTQGREGDKSAETTTSTSTVLEGTIAIEVQLTLSVCLKRSSPP